MSVAISKDGKYIAYSDKDGISIQETDSGDSHRLAGTAGLLVEDWYPTACIFWSVMAKTCGPCSLFPARSTSLHPMSATQPSRQTDRK